MPSHELPPQPQPRPVGWPERAAIDFARDGGRGAGVVALRGEHDISTQMALTRAIVKTGADRSVVVDLSECLFVDSSVIHALVDMALVLPARGDRLVVVVPPGKPQIERVAALTGLTAALPLHPSRAAALASLTPSMQTAPRPELSSRVNDDARRDWLTPSPAIAIDGEEPSPATAAEPARPEPPPSSRDADDDL